MKVKEIKMTEFENWYNQFNNSLTSKTEKKMQERAWRAALEWVKNKLNCEIMPGDIEYFIDKELKNLNKSNS